MPIRTIIRAIYRYYFRPGPKWLMFTYVVTAIAAVAIGIYGRKKHKGARWSICMVFLVFYALTVLTSTVLSRSGGAVEEVNTELFWSWRKALSGSQDGILVLVENIILIAPIGFLLPFINEKRFWALPTILIGFLFTVGIEMSQMLLKRGVFELDDIMNNTIGVVLGYVMAKVVLWVWKMIRDKIVAH